MPVAITHPPVSRPAHRRTNPLDLQTAAIVAMVLVVVRSAAWVFNESAHFDSDQAITGLMAKHLAEGRAFPLFFYGQHYMLAVEAWLAAPVFLVLSPSVAALKLPLLALNLAVVWLLIWILVRQCERTPLAGAGCRQLFHPPDTAGLEPAGRSPGRQHRALSLRARPVVAARTADRVGALAGLAIANREFSATLSSRCSRSTPSSAGRSPVNGCAITCSPSAR